MPDLRTRVAEDARALNVRDWGLSAKLISPDGIVYDTDAITGEPLKVTQILYDRVRIVPETGEDLMARDTIVCFSRLSLERVPQPGEKWAIQIPESPTSSVMADFIISADRSPEGGKSLEQIRLYLQRVEQI